MLKGYYQKYRQIILYLFFGVGTTLVNIIVYYICGHIFDLSVFLSTIIAWILSVLFAYEIGRASCRERVFIVWCRYRWSPYH